MTREDPRNCIVPGFRPLFRRAVEVRKVCFRFFVAGERRFPVNNCTVNIGPEAISLRSHLSYLKVVTGSS
jgi:hypothetical protein